MVAGIGIDIVEIKRITSCIERNGDHFLRKVFTTEERAYCDRHAFPARHYAGRWSAKEAFYKALPPVCQKIATWKSISVVPRDGHRKPAVYVPDTAMDHTLKTCGISRIHLSLSHEHNYCTAVVLLETEKNDEPISSDKTVVTGQ